MRTYWVPDLKCIAGVVVRDNQGRYLLVQEAQPKAYGLWNLPAGHIDDDETPAEAALREGSEETGFQLKLSNDAPIMVSEDASHRFSSFAAMITGGTLQVPESEILQAKWCTYEEVIALNQAQALRISWVFNSITKVEQNS